MMPQGLLGVYAILDCMLEDLLAGTHTLIVGLYRWEIKVIVRVEVVSDDEELLGKRFHGGEKQGRGIWKRYQVGGRELPEMFPSRC